MGIRVASTLPDETELLMERIIGCALEVHRQLGPGFLEGIYRRALAYELRQAALQYEQERPIKVPYKGFQIPGQRVDLIVANAVIVEVKAVTHFNPVHQAQVMSYLRTTGIRAGLLMNFNKMLLKDGLKRVVL